MNEGATSKLFAELVDQYRGKLGNESANALLQGYAAGEQDIVFRVLLENLREMNWEVDDATRTKLYKTAESLDLLNDALGKGFYW